ncbi:hypothetical protein BKP37_03460 [Anaerobacillus alkalilacustris]|uniref:G5 domain-containing protein n=1 Tax=Anaerobacillus alkalilacustris TaxID=393763 RepID=A0A1S2LZ98_9BACI|nr:G5 and 3D domain-containing protein [Anaerobacillus alkalilacustris]OIJ17560.1 hypothetical protein BKP37_03460 [Anaerobacillus alkalilacustris]
MTANMKKLFSVATSGKGLIMSIVSMILLVGVISFSVHEFTKSTVTLVIDGEERSLKTHAKTVDELMLENEILVGEHDYIEPSLDTELTNDANVVWIPAVLVHFTNNGEKTPIWTTSSTVQDLFNELNIDIGSYDRVEPSLEKALVEDMQINYESAFTVTLNSDGEETEVWTTSTTVADFLKAEQVILGELDRVEPEQEEIVKANTEINVIRVEKVTDVVEEAINFATVTRNDNSITRGSEREVQSGQKGKVAKHYEVIIENGKEVSRELIKTETIQDSRDRIVAVGTKQVTQSVSRSSSPTSTSSGSQGDWVTFQSTAYTANCAGCSGITSTGVNLKANPNSNVVAVDPSVIPLGSVVEIKHNGRLLGRYKAADTGGAIVGRKIDIFMSSKNSAINWGRRNVQVRVVNN